MFRRFRHCAVLPTPAMRHADALIAVRCQSSSSSSTTTGGADSNSNKGSSVNRRATMSFGIDPAKLDLNLDFSSMNFGEVAKSTQAAVVTEQRQRATVGLGGDYNRPVVPRDLEGNESTSQAAAANASRKPTSAGSGFHTENPPDGVQETDRSKRTVRGIVGAGGVQDASGADQVRIARQQARREGIRISLHDLLRECVVSNDWNKAFQMFENALRKYPPPSSETSLTDSSIALYDSQRLEIIRRVLAVSTRPEEVEGGRKESALKRPMRRSVPEGVARWNGVHYFFLLKVLLQNGRVAEAERVWEVVEKIGFLNYVMDERTANSLVRLVGQQVPVSQSVHHMLHSEEQKGMLIKKQREFTRNLLTAVESAAASRGIPLVGGNQRIVTSARIATALNEAARSDEGEGNGTAAPSGGSEPVAIPTGVKVGDFNELLHRSSSETSTARVLNMMRKIGLQWDANTYANIISSLRNPKYVLADERVDDNNNIKNVENSGDSEMSPKEQYDVNRKRHLARAREWFDACDPESRNAELFNELLFFYRPRGNEVAFDDLIAQFRGVPFPSPIPGADGSAPATSFAPHLQWRVKPNGRTFEIIIRRYNFYGQKDICWSVYAEMGALGLGGTSRLFDELLQVAQTNPRPGSTSEDTIMSLYDTMRHNHFDVTTVQSTMSLVNAWSTTRRRSKRL